MPKAVCRPAFGLAQLLLRRKAASSEPDSPTGLRRLCRDLCDSRLTGLQETCGCTDPPGGKCAPQRAFLLTFFGAHGIATREDFAAADTGALKRRLVEQYQLAAEHADWVVDTWHKAVCPPAKARKPWSVLAAAFVALTVAVCLLVWWLLCDTITIPLGGSAAMELRRIRPGATARGDGSLVHVEKTYWIGVTELTQTQYVAVMGTRPRTLLEWQARNEASRKAPVVGDRLPVMYVEWELAQEFCRRLNRTASARGLVFSLPSRYEWEFACRARKSTDFHTGPTIRPGIDANMGQVCLLPVEVGKGARNAFGLYDMHGNVAEWCQEAESEGSDRHLVCGGSYFDPPDLARAFLAVPEYVGPSMAKAKVVGFRVVAKRIAKMGN